MNPKPVLLLMLLTFLVACTSDLNKAKEFVKVANYQQAVVYFDKYIDKNSDDVDAYIGRGYCALMLGDYPKADQCAVSAFKIKPDYVIKGEYSKPYEERFTKLAKETRLNKDYETSFVYRSFILQCEISDSIKAYTWLTMGAAKSYLKKKDEALVWYMKSFRIDRNNLDIGSNIAACYDPEVYPDSVIKYTDYSIVVAKDQLSKNKAYQGRSNRILGFNMLNEAEKEVYYIYDCLKGAYLLQGYALLLKKELKAAAEKYYWASYYESLNSEYIFNRDYMISFMDGKKQCDSLLAAYPPEEWIRDFCN